ncbi:MAG: hypothetical protein H6573_30480 [Lewinellaceae bacterium]|nr:hypothetical protein [Phaeodactylibacter sp.]MCB9351786.1 hypothetical protein [Lewinellaceae bacterium]
MKPNLLDFSLFPLSDWRQFNERLSGNNARRVLIVLERLESDSELMDFLGKILSAVQLNLEEDTLLLRLTKGENISFSRLSQVQPVRYVLLFGIAPRQLGLHFSLPPGQPMRFGETYFLHTSALLDIFEERKAKARPKAGALWNNLKQLFIDSNA